MRHPEALRTLSQVFGYQSFRPGQGEVVDALLSGRDVLAVMPTGAGKSLIYQLPAILMGGLALVISPLVSLMADQVAGLSVVGLRGSYLNSTLSPRQRTVVMQRALAGAYQIMFVAPERLDDPEFAVFARQIRMPLLAVDEAHCISQWGHDFRPAYLRIADFVDSLSVRPHVAALTATATADVRLDIIKRLRLRDPYVAVTGFDRPNLSFAVRHCAMRDKTAEIERFLRGHRSDSGIVYCATRKAVDELCSDLVANGFAAVRYRAGIPAEEREANQRSFGRDDAQVMVATNAFGMGIDKSNVRFVVHYNMPKNLEAYYQEAGRAGRDGEPAECLLLFAEGDIRTARYLIENGEGLGIESEEEHEKRIGNDLRLLEKMVGYCRTTECLRGYLLDYFGEPHAPGGCGRCSNCTGSFSTTDVTRAARDVLACVRQLMPRSYGKTVVADVLRGADTKRLRELGLARLPAYGLLQGMGSGDVKDLIDYLADNGYLRVEGGRYPVMCLGPRARELDEEDARVTMRTADVAATPSCKQHSRGARGVRGEELPERGEELFERLRALRKRIADETGVPPYIVFSDATLRSMCAACPRDEAQLLACPGVGAVKLKRYGKYFLREIALFSLETGYRGFGREL